MTIDFMFSASVVVLFKRLEILSVIILCSRPKGFFINEHDPNTIHFGYNDETSSMFVKVYKSFFFFFLKRNDFRFPRSYTRIYNP